MRARVFFLTFSRSYRPMGGTMAIPRHNWRTDFAGAANLRLRETAQPDGRTGRRRGETSERRTRPKYHTSRHRSQPEVICWAESESALTHLNFLRATPGVSSLSLSLSLSLHPPSFQCQCNRADFQPFYPVFLTGKKWSNSIDGSLTSYLEEKFACVFVT